jgi:hypothetical protein
MASNKTRPKNDDGAYHENNWFHGCFRVTDHSISALVILPRIDGRA